MLRRRAKILSDTPPVESHSNLRHTIMVTKPNWRPVSYLRAYTHGSSLDGHDSSLAYLASTQRSIGLRGHIRYCTKSWTLPCQNISAEGTHCTFEYNSASSSESQWRICVNNVVFPLTWPSSAKLDLTRVYSLKKNTLWRSGK